jgi:hypothetical protein
MTLSLWPGAGFTGGNCAEAKAAVKKIARAINIDRWKQILFIIRHLAI